MFASRQQATRYSSAKILGCENTEDKTRLDHGVMVAAETAEDKFQGIEEDKTAAANSRKHRGWCMLQSIPVPSSLCRNAGSKKGVSMKPVYVSFLLIAIGLSAVVAGIMEDDAISEIHWLIDPILIGVGGSILGFGLGDLLKAASKPKSSDVSK